MCASPNPERAHELKSKHLVESKTPARPEHSDDDIMAQQDRIAEEVAKSQPLVGKLQKLSELEEEYKNNAKFLKKIQTVDKRFPKGFRRVRGDGNCFYRAYLFGCFESMRNNEDQVSEFAKFILGSLDRLEKAGFPRLTTEDAHDTIIDLVSWLKTESRSSDEIAEKFNDQGVSDYMVMYLRLLTSAHLKVNAKKYEVYLQGKVMSDFLRQEVEGMGKEADYVQCVALASEFGIPVQIEYVDLSEGDVPSHVFPESKSPKVYLLYRPGHYDSLRTD